MNWLYTFLLIHIINDVKTFEKNLPLSNVDVSTEIPKPIQPLIFEELDSSYKKAKKLKWQSDKSKKPSMVEIALEVAAREGINAMTDLYQNIEPQIVKNGQILEDNHPAALLSKFSAPVEGNERSAMAAFATLSATKAFRRNNKESTVLGRQAQSQKVSFRRTPLEGLCPPREQPTCMPASQRYRTHDGTCNNRRRLRWGSGQMPFNRFLPPEYGDGVDSIRGSVEGGALSSARFVSLLVHGAKEGEAPLTLMIVQWGQLLDHDMTSTAQPRSINGSVPSCCGSKDFHPLCFPIKVPLDDPWLAPLKVRCLEFLRSAPAQRRDCVLSWREQTNQVTSFIDASPIYSSNAKTSDNARIFRNGLLIYGRGDPADDVCMRGAIAHQCIRSGDGRSGEQPGLLALHHVWVGEHNRIAMELSILNPHWSDEKVYQETRRIIGALFQHITFREFLPIVLGREVCKLFDLELKKSGYYSGYDSNVNPTVSNAFAAAAFRFGHSLVQNTYMRCDRNHNFINNNVTLHEEFQQGDIGSAGSLHRLLRGMATQKALKRDEFITPELTNHLFQTPGFPFGLDLAAINIQRGRDHGIAPYTAWRQPCGLSAINTWDELSNVVGPESAKRISHAYRNVHDIDLFVGGIAERPVIGGLVGPTFACIIAQQFSNSRKGDRFWYENSGFESSFTPAQLNALRHVSLSSVLCRAINGGTLQPYVFLPNDVKGNKRIKCGKDSLEPIDLKPWLEQDPFLMSNQEIDQNVSFQGTPLSTEFTTKEEKFINDRIQNVTMVANVDFIPNSSIGFHRVTNMTKIHDKLDMAQKLVARPITKPIRGINNKLDKHRLTVKKNHKPTASSALKRISTTRRTVVIHNVQIELRSANGANKDPANKKKKTDAQQNLPKSTAQNTILKVADVVKSQISAAMGFLSDNDDDASTKHLSRQMNDQTAAATILTNLTNFSSITNPVTVMQTETRLNINLTKSELFDSKNKPKVNSPRDKPTTGVVPTDVQDISADLISKSIRNITEAINSADELNHKSLTTNNISTERPDQTLNITNNQIRSTILTNMTNEFNETDITKEQPKVSRTDTFKNSPTLDPSRRNIETNLTDELNHKNTFISTERPDQTFNITNNQIRSTILTNMTNEFNETFITKNEPIISRTDTLKYLQNLDPSRQNIETNLTTERPDQILNITNNQTTPTKLTKFTSTIKQLKETDSIRKESTNLRTETLKNSPYFDRSKFNIETSRNNNDLTNNSTIINSNIDSEQNDSTNPTKESLQDNKQIPHIFKDKTTNDQNKQSTAITSELPLDQKDKRTLLDINSNDGELKIHFSESHDSYKDFQDIINSALQDSLDQHKRVHRKTDHKNVQIKKVEFQTNLDFEDKIRTLRLGQANDFSEAQLTASEFDRLAEVDLSDNNFTEADDLTVPINTEPPATLRNIDIRQFQERPIYSRPQKLILDAPKSDQYEIEINIRQTNTKPPQNNANYEDYSPNKRYDNDRYNQNYEYTNPHQNSPSNSFFTPTTRAPYVTRTKPPTIIYINEHDDRRTTRGPPGIFQNILSFATNSLNSIKQQGTSTESPFNHNPNRIGNSGHNSASENYLSSNPSWPYQHSKPSSSNYPSGQQSQTYPPTQGFPQQGFPQQGFPQSSLNYNPAIPQGFPHQNIYPPQGLPGANSFSTSSNIGGVSHASSNAVSTGHFGAIAGSAASTGGDSTFSFNIRPSARPQLNLMSPTAIKPDYELLPQRRPQYSSTPSYANPPKPMLSVESYEYPPNKHDPFSSYTRRPPYYNKQPNNVFDPSYDDIGRSELTIDDGFEHDVKANHTMDNEDFDTDDYDYSDNDNFKINNDINEQDSTKIDYLRLAELTLTNRTKLNAKELDDNFVLPVLQRNDKFIKSEKEDLNVTNLTTGEQKSLSHDIFAEDYDELLTGRSSFLDSQTSYIMGQWNKSKKPTQSVAFAPIQILTKPERPDNWVIFDDLDQKPLLPIQPDFITETLVADEVPMPFAKHKITRNSTKTTQMTKLNDKNFSTETSNFDMTTTLTSEQPTEEITTETIFDELTTSAEHLTHELDETTDTNNVITVKSESSNLKIEEERQELSLNFGTEASNEKNDSTEKENSTDIPKTLQTN